MPPQKQATKGQKQIVEENKSTLKFYAIVASVTTILHLLVVYAFYWSSVGTLNIILIIFTIVIFIACHKFMMYMAKPTYSATGQLLDGGIDLNMESGVAEDVKDLIILTAACQVLALISNYFWLLWLLAPARAFYKLWVNILSPWIFQPAPEIDEKKQRKLERKAQRRH